MEDGNTAGAAAAAAAAAGANALAPSAAVEAESLLTCLAELLPTLEEALGMTDEVRRRKNLRHSSVGLFSWGIELDWLVVTRGAGGAGMKV